MADTLLLVVDDAGVQRNIGEYFERIGYEVWRERSGEQAVHTFQRVRPDVVLLDLHLADASGLVVLERLRREGAAIILLTGQGDIGTAVRAMQRAREDRRDLQPKTRRYQARSLSEVERQHIERTLRHHGGNRTHAAIELGISRATLINKIKTYSLNI